jgi:hypothetical protein
VASDRQQNFEFLIVLSIIWKTIKSLKLGELHEKHAVATFNLGTISAFV